VLIERLKARGVRYGVSDYWTAYYVSFLTNEQIIMKSADFPRIYEYDRQVEAHLNEAVRVSRTPCPGGETVLPGLYLCRP
jgi:IS1 family transposase